MISDETLQHEQRTGLLNSSSLVEEQVGYVGGSFTMAITMRMRLDILFLMRYFFLFQNSLS
jgi:hypothetical protein